MPLIARASLAYAVGLFIATQVGGRATFALVLLVGAALVADRWSRAPAERAGTTARGLCLALVAAGLLVGLGAARRTEACRARLVAARSLEVVLGDDARAGVAAHGTARRRGCAVPVLLLVRRGAGLAGEEVVASGQGEIGARGLVVRDASLASARPGPALAAARARVGRRIDRLFGADAPMVRALVIADMAGIAPEERDRFARAGLVHMLSVSGLHVAILALALVLVGSALRIPAGPSHLATLALLAGYVLLIGAPPPAVRAAIMLALVLASRALQRPTSRWAVLAVGGVVPLVEPAVVTDLGWQLSVAGTVALVAGAALARRVVPHGWRGARRSLATAAVVSTVATVVTAPLVAWTVGRLALLAPVTNLVADPVMGLLQPLLFLALVVPLPAVERVAADAAHAPLALFHGIAAFAAALPGASPVVLPTALAALAGGIGAVALVVACVSRRPYRALVAAGAAVVVMVVEPLLPPMGRLTEFHMLDVGQGDALAIRTRAGRWIVIDAGRSWAGGDAGRSIVVPYLGHRGGDVALFMLSHPHADHVGGAASLFDARPPALFLDPGYVGTSPPYREALAAAARDGVPWRRVHPGDSLVVDEVVVTLLAPDSAWAATLQDANLASTVARVRVGRIRLLLTGDAEGPEEAWLLAHAPDQLAAEVLKVGHHGSATSTTAPFLAAVHPRVALVSVGARNDYGHPSAEVMAALARSGARVFRTDRAGAVVVRTDGRRLDVVPERGAPAGVAVPEGAGSAR